MRFALGFNEDLPALLRSLHRRFAVNPEVNLGAKNLRRFAARMKSNRETGDTAGREKDPLRSHPPLARKREPKAPKWHRFLAAGFTPWTLKIPTIEAPKEGQ